MEYSSQNLLTYNLRKAEPYDEDHVYKMICELENVKLNRITFSSRYQLNLMNKLINYSVIEDSTGRLIGFCSCHIQNVLHHESQIAEIQELFVIQDYRGKGIGKVCIEEMKRFSILNHVESLEVAAQLFRKSTHTFYVKCGFSDSHKKFTMKF